jgi:hypothetical protein
MWRRSGRGLGRRCFLFWRPGRRIFPADGDDGKKPDERFAVQSAVGGFACPRGPLVVRSRSGAGSRVFRRPRYRARRWGSSPAGKLRVTDDKVLIETPEFADGFFLIEGAKPAAVFVRPAARTFMEARQSSRLTQVFVRVDPEDPCRTWQAMARGAGVADHEGWRCERVGEETIDGHRVIAYRAVSPQGRQLLGWIDAVRKFPLRIKSEDGATVTAQNVRDEPQPAPLFEIPAGFRKFDPQILIQQIKQSDVWVAGEKDLDISHRWLLSAQARPRATRGVLAEAQICQTTDLARPRAIPRSAPFGAYGWIESQRYEKQFTQQKRCKSSDREQKQNKTAIAGTFVG